MPTDQMEPGHPPGEEGTQKLSAELTMSAIEETQNQIQQTEEHIRRLVKEYRETDTQHPNKTAMAHVIIVFLESQISMKDNLKELLQELSEIPGHGV